MTPRLDFYDRHYRKMFAPLLDLMTHGIAVDVEGQKALHSKLRAECDNLADTIDNLLGVNTCARCREPKAEHKEVEINLNEGLFTKAKKPKEKKPKLLKILRCPGKVTQLRFSKIGATIEVREGIKRVRVAQLRKDDGALITLPPDDPNIALLIAQRSSEGTARVAGRWGAFKGARKAAVLDLASDLAHSFKPSGESITAKKDLSTPKVKALLYNHFGFPTLKAGGKETANEVALRRCLLKAERLSRLPRAKSGPLWKRKPSLAVKIITAILQHRTASKTATFLVEGKLDQDGRLRCSYKFTTKTGRLASSSNPMGTGMNLQNVQRSIRQVFIPDEGCIFLEADLSQAESRVVSCLTGDKGMIEQARLPSYEFDVHTHNAALVFRIPESEVTKEQRYLGKRAVHACLTDDHEVLTAEGWKGVATVTAKDAVAEWAEDGSVTFRCPIAVHEYDAPSTLLAWEGQAYSQVVTPNHRMPYVTNGKVKVAQAADLWSQCRTGRLPTSGLFAPAAPTMPMQPDVVRFIAAFQADGHYLHERRINFQFKKQRKINRLTALLTRLGWDFTTKKYATGVTRVTALVPPLPFGLKWKEVKLFGPWLLKFSEEGLDALLDEVAHWDGSTRKAASYYFSGSLENAQWVQTIAHLRGRQALIRKGNRCWRVSFNVRTLARLGKPKEVITEHSPYARVYCLTTTSGFFLVRRNNRISVTGNSNYGMKGERLSEILLLDGYIRTPDECTRMIESFMAARPSIRNWQADVRKALMRSGTLRTSWGREFSIAGQRLSDDLYKEAYAFVPQSEVGDLLNQYGLIPVWRELRRRKLKSRINLQVHDALVISCPPNEVAEVAQIVKDALERPRVYTGPWKGKPVELLIPAEFKVGLNWAFKPGVEWKKLPDAKDIQATVNELWKERSK